MQKSDTLSQATVPARTADEAHTVCSLQRVQQTIENINQADHLNVTSQRLAQIRHHTDRDTCLHLLEAVVLQGWPESKEETTIASGNIGQSGMRSAHRMGCFSEARE